MYLFLFLIVMLGMANSCLLLLFSLSFLLPPVQYLFEAVDALDDLFFSDAMIGTLAVCALVAVICAGCIWIFRQNPLPTGNCLWYLTGLLQPLMIFFIFNTPFAGLRLPGETLSGGQYALGIFLCVLGALLALSYIANAIYSLHCMRRS